MNQEETIKKLIFLNVLIMVQDVKFVLYTLVDELIKLYKIVLEYWSIYPEPHQITAIKGSANIINAGKYAENTFKCPYFQ